MAIEPSWQMHAQCKSDNAAYFFTTNHFERKDEKDLREGKARALCRVCRVQSQCLEYALLVQERHGIWGGLNELERRRLLRARRASA